MVRIVLHGTRSKYNMGCCCYECTLANRMYAKKNKDKYNRQRALYHQKHCVEEKRKQRENYHQKTKSLRLMESEEQRRRRGIEPMKEEEKRNRYDYRIVRREGRGCKYTYQLESVYGREHKTWLTLRSVYLSKNRRRATGSDFDLVIALLIDARKKPMIDAKTELEI